MTIGIDASRANKNFKTGTEWYSYYLIINLIKIDKKNKYILYLDKDLQESFLNSLNLAENKHVKVKVLKWPFKYLWTLVRLSLEMIFKSPDVLFVPAHSLALLNPRKTVNTIHDIAFIENDFLYSQESMDINFKNKNNLLNFFIKFFTLGKYGFKSLDHLKWSTKHALRKARKIIAVSNFTKSEILKNYKKVNPNKIEIVHNGFNKDLYKVIEDQDKINLVLKKYGLGQRFFLYVGRMEKKKNVHNLVEAFAIFKENNKDSDEKLVLVGSAGFAYDEIKYIIEELGIDSDVIFLGWVEEEDLPYIFNRAEAFIFPSFYEGFGIPTLQAMACASPLILSDIEVLHEVAGDAALFFNPHNADDLARKMNIIARDEAVRQDLIEKGLLRVKNFSWEKCAQETLKVLNNL